MTSDQLLTNILSDNKEANHIKPRKGFALVVTVPIVRRTKKGPKTQDIVVMATRMKPFPDWHSASKARDRYLLEDMVIKVKICLVSTQYDPPHHESVAELERLSGLTKSSKVDKIDA